MITLKQYFRNNVKATMNMLKNFVATTHITITTPETYHNIILILFNVWENFLTTCLIMMAMLKNFLLSVPLVFLCFLKDLLFFPKNLLVQKPVSILAPNKYSNASSIALCNNFAVLGTSFMSLWIMSTNAFGNDYEDLSYFGYYALLVWKTMHIAVLCAGAHGLAFREFGFVIPLILVQINVIYCHFLYAERNGSLDLYSSYNRLVGILEGMAIFQLIIYVVLAAYQFVTFWIPTVLHIFAMSATLASFCNSSKGNFKRARFVVDDKLAYAGEGKDCYNNSKDYRKKCALEHAALSRDLKSQEWEFLAKYYAEKRGYC